MNLRRTRRRTFKSRNLGKTAMMGQERTRQWWGDTGAATAAVAVSAGLWCDGALGLYGIWNLARLYSPVHRGCGIGGKGGLNCQ